MKQPDDNGPRSSSTAEGEYIWEEKGEASLGKQGTDKVLNSSKTCKMKTIFVKETAVGRLMASEYIQARTEAGWNFVERADTHLLAKMSFN